jgi:two-component system cell cycle sensor histidine kinase/response regulator CckA
VGRVEITVDETDSSPFETVKLEAAKFKVHHYAVLSVSDNGRGIPEDLIDKIFDPFVTSKFTGRGLGLAAAQGTVKGHDGILKAESKIDSGTTFKMFLPTVKPD